MKRWVYWASLMFILVVVGLPVLGIVRDPQADWHDLFRLGIDLEGGTSLIYELRAPEGGTAPDAGQAKHVIMGRIDPQGTRGYTVRAIGKHRLEIVLPGRQTRVRIEEEAATPQNTAAAQEAAQKQNPATAVLIQDHEDALAGGIRLAVRMKPPLYLDDIQNRIAQAVRERLPHPRPPVAVVGLDPVLEQWERVAVLIGERPADAKGLEEWKRLITSALSAQQDVTRVKRLVRQAGFLEFRIVADKVRDRDKTDFSRLIRLKQAGEQPDTPQYRWYPLRRGYEWYRQGLLDAWNFVYVVDEESRTVEVLVDVGDGQDVTGKDLSRAVGSSQDGEPIVSFSLKAEAGARFARLTSPENRNRHLAIVLDGTVQSAPVLRATLSTGGIIEGYRNNIRERDEVVTILNSGQLAASLGDPVTERTVGPELGADNIRRGLQASVIGFALVVLFIVVYYRAAGLVADFALGLNVVLVVCIMCLIRQAWTLPGIAGMILALAMAVDANVLIYERLREEKGKEGSLGFALKKAYERAFTTIFDSNLTTVIPAFVLLLPGLATEEVKGFAVVIIIGILVSMFTAVVVTRMIFETGLKWGLIKQLRMFQLFGTPTLDWMRFVRVAVVVSGAMLLLGAIVFFSRGKDKYDIEFIGGTQVELALKTPEGQKDVPIELVRRRVGEAIGPGVTVQELEYATEAREGLNHFLISVPALGKLASGESAVKEVLAKAFADMQPEQAETSARATASKITDALLRERFPLSGGAPPPAAERKTSKEAAAPAAPAVRYLPPEVRQFLAKICLEVDVNPPLAEGEVRRRIDAFLRDRYPDLVGTLYRITGRSPAGTAGEFGSFEILVRQDYAGRQADVENPARWTEIVQQSLGAEQPFASTTSFEPTMAAETGDKAVVAILLSLVAMIFYIWVRFAKLASGLAAVVALIHDVVVTLGAVAVSAYLADTFLGTTLLLTDLKINLPMVGAFLTLVGYSVNDTIVVFDRIRENRGKYGDLSQSVVNTSINQTLSRTVLTSFTVFVAVVSLYFFAGKSSSVHGLSFVMMIGTLVGTYSSIVIASPILVQREYLRKVYAWVYPILMVGLLGYFVFLWKSPGEFFASWTGWVWAAGQLVWTALAWQAASSNAYGRPWMLAVKAPALGRFLAGLSLLVPPATVGLPIALLAAGPGATWVNWVGPAAFGALITCPVTLAMYRLVWGGGAEKKS